MKNAEMPVRASKCRVSCSANYLSPLMIIILMIPAPSTFITHTAPPPCTPMPKSDIYSAAPTHLHTSYPLTWLNRAQKESG